MTLTDTGIELRVVKGGKHLADAARDYRSGDQRHDRRVPSGNAMFNFRCGQRRRHAALAGQCGSRRRQCPTPHWTAFLRRIAYMLGHERQARTCRIGDGFDATLEAVDDAGDRLLAEFEDPEAALAVLRELSLGTKKLLFAEIMKNPAITTTDALIDQVRRTAPLDLMADEIVPFLRSMG